MNDSNRRWAEQTAASSKTQGKQKTNRVKLKGSSEPRAYPYQTLEPAGSATMQNTSLTQFRAAVG